MVIKEEDHLDYDCPLKLGNDMLYQRCNGKKCMAWVWLSMRNPDQDPFSKQWIDGDTEGYCGMIG